MKKCQFWKCRAWHRLLMIFSWLLIQFPLRGWMSYLSAAVLVSNHSHLPEALSKTVPWERWHIVSRVICGVKTFQNTLKILIKNKNKIIIIIKTTKNPHPLYIARCATHQILLFWSYLCWLWLKTNWGSTNVWNVVLCSYNLRVLFDQFVQVCSTY